MSFTPSECFVVNMLRDSVGLSGSQWDSVGLSGTQGSVLGHSSGSALTALSRLHTRSDIASPS